LPGNSIFAAQEMMAVADSWDIVVGMDFAQQYCGNPNTVLGYCRS
jgi:hypothetical protein